MAVKGLAWSSWTALTLAVVTYLGYVMFASADKRVLLAGDTSHGHYQIELACEACHGEAFGGPEAIQQACVSCHGDELAAANDSHPASKFKDPRNAQRLELLDARRCVSCHVEHQPDRTAPMGVTLPGDFCQHCHQDIAQERPSHAGLGFETCASAGCHNYHDNQALYEDFLVKHGQESWLALHLQRPDLAPSSANLLHQIIASTSLSPPAAETLDLPATVIPDPTVINQWHQSEHAAAGVSCRDCHDDETGQWQAKSAIEQCGTCHEGQVEGFTQGRHGMRLDPRLARDLSPMQPQLARLPFKDEADHQQLTCNSCHQAHDYDRVTAAVDSCLGCHADSHSQNFVDSPHHKLWQAEVAGLAAPGTGVSCASCHLPTEEHDGELVVNHNQNANLRPNEKMIRSVCMDCHGLAFAIDALADEALIRNNFNGQPANHIRSIDMALERAETKP